MAEKQEKYAVRIQSLYRGHAFRCDPANEEILEELHNRLENLIMGGALTDGAASLVAQTAASAGQVKEAEAAKAGAAGAKAEAAAPESEAEYEKNFMKAMKSNMARRGIAVCALSPAVHYWSRFSFARFPAFVFQGVDSGEGKTAKDDGKAKALAKVKLFQKCKIEATAVDWVEERVKAGDNICVQGEEGDKLFVISSGSANVKQNGKGIKMLKEGNMFGEIALLQDDHKRTATVVAKTDVVLLSLSRDAFLKHFGSGNKQAVVQEAMKKKLAADKARNAKGGKKGGKKDDGKKKKKPSKIPRPKKGEGDEEKKSDADGKGGEGGKPGFLKKGSGHGPSSHLQFEGTSVDSFGKGGGGGGAGGVGGRRKMRKYRADGRIHDGTRPSRPGGGKGGGGGRKGGGKKGKRGGSASPDPRPYAEYEDAARAGGGGGGGVSALRDLPDVPASSRAVLGDSEFENAAHKIECFLADARQTIFGDPSQQQPDGDGDGDFDGDDPFAAGGAGGAPRRRASGRGSMPGNTGGRLFPPRPEDEKRRLRESARMQRDLANLPTSKADLHVSLTPCNNRPIAHLFVCDR